MKKKKKRDYSFWTRAERICLESGVWPKGRSRHACRCFCSRNHIPFPGFEELDTNEELLKKFNATKGNQQP